MKGAELGKVSPLIPSSLPGTKTMTDRPTKTVRRRVKPKSWSARIKYHLNDLWQRLFGKPLFKLGAYDLFGSAPRWQRKIIRRWHAFSKDTNFPYAIGLFIFCVATLFGWHTFAPKTLPDVWVEFVGLTFDVFFILIIFASFEYRRQKAQDLRRQQEIVDDYKKWDSEEAKFRIAGAIRRLNRLGKTAIDFGGIELREFSFRRHDIKSINSSTFYDGTWGELGSRDNVILEKVDFSHVDCRGVVFSKFNPFGGVGIDLRFASIIDCDFVGSDLSGAIFNGAHLEWTTDHPTELGAWHEFPDAPPAFEQTYYPPFCEASLSTASFAEARFKNADFRQASGILQCDFEGAKGLETCLFDDEDTKEAVLGRARENSGDAKQH